MPRRTCGAHLTCADGEVHVWRVDLTFDGAAFDTLESLLSDSERERAARFMTQELRWRWTAAHASVRAILSLYVGVSAQALALATDKNQKPWIATGGPRLFFNLTHTAHLAFVAVSTSAEVGIDAEVVRPDFDCEDIARRFFGPAEANAICSEAPHCRVAAFFRCWTRKEAYLKAIATGLSTALDSFEVTVSANEPARLLWAADDADAGRRWRLEDLSEPGVAVALATERLDRVRRFVCNVPQLMTETATGRSA